MTEKDIAFRSNPFSQPNNMLNAYIDNEYATVPVEVTYTVNAGATSIALTSSLPADNTLSYLRMTVTDGAGVEAVGSYDVGNIAGGATVDTSLLDANTDWLCQIHWAEPKASQDEPKFDSIEFVLSGAKGNATDSFDTTQAIGTARVFAELIVNGTVTIASTLVANGGTFAAGNITQNDTAIIRMYFRNTKPTKSVLRILSYTDNAAAVTASTTFGSKPFLPLLVASSETSVAYLDAAIDTTVLGAIAASSVTVDTNDVANLAYVVNVTATIV